MRMKIKLSDAELKVLSREELAKLTRGEAIALLEAEQKMRASVVSELAAAKEHIVEVSSKYRSIIAKVFDRTSEKSPPCRRGQGGTRGSSRSSEPRPPRLPSERYPDAEVHTKTVTMDPPPPCPCCLKSMTASGMFETSEALTKIPAKFVVERTLRAKYRCSGCHGALVTTPPSPRLIPGSSYADSLIIDVSLAKYCDLIPIERYCRIAARQGFTGLPPHSLIATTIKFAASLSPLYQLIRTEVLTAIVMFADETPHRMLEGDERSNWFLWLFMCKTALFYEMHGSRSGEVASNVLAASLCEVLMSDVYSGYKRAVREANELRRLKGLPEITTAYCNAHARRGFVVNAVDSPTEAEWMTSRYRELYRINADAKDQPDATVLELRSGMRPIFDEMLDFSLEQRERFSTKSALGKAFNYFTTNFSGLTVFLTNPHVDIDNNCAERGLRSHVVGRKTWYGTHSQEAAEAAAIHMTIIETCKLNGVNPREYYHYAVEEIHAGRMPLTPHKYKLHKEAQTKNSS